QDRNFYSGAVPEPAVSKDPYRCPVVGRRLVGASVMLGTLLVAIGLVAAVKAAWLEGITKRPSRAIRLVGAGLVRKGSAAGHLLLWAGFLGAGLGMVGLFRPLPRRRIAAVLG